MEGSLIVAVIVTPIISAKTAVATVAHAPSHAAQSSTKKKKKKKELKEGKVRPAKDGSRRRALAPLSLLLRGLSGDSTDTGPRGLPSFLFVGVLGGQVCRNAAACERHSCAWGRDAAPDLRRCRLKSRRHDCTLSQRIHSESTAAGLTGDGGGASGKEVTGWPRRCKGCEAFRRRPHCRTSAAASVGG